MKEYDLTKSLEMFEKAKTLIPNGIFGPRNPMFLGNQTHPCFFRSGKGGRAIDVDGNEYIDYMCSFGANLLGYLHPKVEEAVNKQMQKGGLMTMPMDVWTELAEYLVEHTPLADWVIFAKNGSDVTTWCTNVARVHTKKKKILMAMGSYHGFHSWSVPTPTGVPDEHRAGVVTFTYNSIESFTKAFEKHKDELAAVILTPIKHDIFQDLELPVPGYFDAVRKACDENNVVFIMDDIRCCYRLKFEGSHEYFNTTPDLVTIGKGMANGHPIAVAYGTEKMKQAACQVYFSGTHFYSGAPMAAALAALEIIRTEGVIEKINHLGQMLKDGMLEQAQSHGVEVSWSGPLGIPFMRFPKGGPAASITFAGSATKRGVFLHPHHNWFVCAGHTEEDIKQTLEVTDECFAIVKKQIG